MIASLAHVELFPKMSTKNDEKLACNRIVYITPKISASSSTHMPSIMLHSSARRYPGIWQSPNLTLNRNTGDQHTTKVQNSSKWQVRQNVLQLRWKPSRPERETNKRNRRVLMCKPMFKCHFPRLKESQDLTVGTRTMTRQGFTVVAIMNQIELPRNMFLNVFL